MGKIHQEQKREGGGDGKPGTILQFNQRRPQNWGEESGNYTSTHYVSGQSRLGKTKGMFFGSKETTPNGNMEGAAKGEIVQKGR